MKESPILFSAPMIRAIQDDRKTQTRRLIRGLPDGAEPATLDEWRAAKADPRMADPSPRLTLFKRHVDPSEADGRGVLPSGVFGVPCPFGGPGDRLWVRETWYDDFQNGEQNPAGIYYRADGEPHEQGFEDLDGFAWRPSIFMPRWASRITLAVTAVRVERLQNISEEDAKAEGVTPFAHDPEGDCWTALPPERKHRTAFEYLWGEINGWQGEPKARAPWASNPWVWVVTFQRVE